MALDQSYITGTVDWMEIYTNRRGALKFTAGMSGNLVSVEVNVKKEGSPNNLVVAIYSKSGVSGYPDTLLASEIIAVGGIDTSYGWITVNFSSPAEVVSGTDYFIVVYEESNGGDASNSYWWRGNSTPSVAFWSQNAGASWGSLGGIFNYKTYVEEEAGNGLFFGASF